MDKNYYEILEVDRNASPEIIEKAYKTLAKKYHPDLQDDIHKKESEEVFKVINEAYQTLSDPEQRALYNQKIENTIVSQDKYDEMSRQNEVLKNKLNHLQQHMYHENNTTPNQTYSQNINPVNNTNNHTNHNDHSSNTQETYQNIQAEQYRKNLEYEKQVNQARQQAYHDAYIQDLKNRGYKIRYKKTFSDRIKDFIALLIFIGILLLLWQLPFVRNFFLDIYNNNPLIQVFVNLFKK